MQMGAPQDRRAPIRNYTGDARHDHRAPPLTWLSTSVEEVFDGDRELCLVGRYVSLEAGVPLCVAAFGFFFEYLVRQLFVASRRRVDVRSIEPFF